MPPASGRIDSFRNVVIALSITSATLAAHRVDAQQPRVIRDDSPCDSCRVRFERVVVLGDETGEGFVSAPAGIEFWNNQWIVAHWVKPTTFSVYGETGSFIRDVGRAGEGPGEFRRAGRLLVHNDTMFVVDHELGRLSAFDKEFRVQRTIRMPTGSLTAIERLPNGNFIISAASGNRTALGQPLHVFDPNGVLLRSFGVERPIVRPDQPHRNQRLITIAPDGTIWSARRTEFVLEQWDSAGRKLAEIRREASWFPPHGKGGFTDRDTPPNPTINAFWIDEDGRAWIGLELPDPRWKDAVVYRGVVQGRARWGVEDQNAYFDTVVEVLDMAAGRLIARGRLDYALGAPTIPGLLVTYREGRDGSQVIEVWRPRTVSNERGGA